MIYPDVTFEDWCKKYNLKPMSSSCAKCKLPFTTTVPILMQGCAGLATPTHECGPHFVSVVLTPKTDKAKKHWANVVKYFELIK